MSRHSCHCPAPRGKDCPLTPEQCAARAIEPAHDERIMCDGRPAFAWWNEIQMLRADKGRVDNLTQEMLDMNALLRIVRVYLDEHPETGDIVIRLSRLERIEARSTTLRGLIAEYIAAERALDTPGGRT